MDMLTVADVPGSSFTSSTVYVPKFTLCSRHKAAEANLKSSRRIQDTGIILL